MYEILKNKNLVWPISWENKDPEYWFNKEDSFQEALEEFSKSSKVYIVTYHPNRRDNIRYKGINYLFCRDTSEILRKIKTLKPNLINFWGYGLPLNRELHFMLPSIRKTVYGVGGELEQVYNDLSYVSAVFVTTKEDKQILSQKFNYPQHQIIIAPFTGTNRFLLASGNTERYDVLYIGSWNTTKRQHLLLQALKNIKFTRIGFIGSRTDNLYFNKYKDYISKTYQGGYIEVIDKVPGIVIPTYYREAKIIVLLSKSEGGSRVLTETLSCGKPIVVCSDCISNKNRIINGKTGFIVKPNPKAIAETINYLLENKSIREEVGKAAYNLIKIESKDSSMFKVFRKEFTKILLGENIV